MATDSHAITGVATSITLFIGWAADGPDDKAIRIASFADYARSFGGLDARLAAAGRVALRHSSRDAIRAPSAIAFSFAQVIFGSTVMNPAKVEKPQSLPAITFSRPLKIFPSMAQGDSVSLRPAQGQSRFDGLH